MRCILCIARVETAFLSICYLLQESKKFAVLTLGSQCLYCSAVNDLSGPFSSNTLLGLIIPSRAVAHVRKLFILMRRSFNIMTTWTLSIMCRTICPYMVSAVFDLHEWWSSRQLIRWLTVVVHDLWLSVAVSCGWQWHDLGTLFWFSCSWLASTRFLTASSSRFARDESVDSCNRIDAGHRQSTYNFVSSLHWLCGHHQVVTNCRGLVVLLSLKRSGYTYDKTQNGCKTFV